MKSINFLGLALIIIGAVILILSYFLGWSNNNAITAGAFAAMVVGLVTYIIAGKKCMEKN